MDEDGDDDGDDGDDCKDDDNDDGDEGDDEDDGEQTRTPNLHSMHAGSGWFGRDAEPACMHARRGGEGREQNSMAHLARNPP